MPVAAHVQIVRAMTTPERRALVARFLDRNRASGTWLVNEAALADSVAVLDPFRGFLRRARRASAPDASSPSSSAAPVDSLTVARAFVGRNADLLGLSPSIVVTLAAEARAAEHGAPEIVHFDATFPTKGYEAFPELENEIDLDVSVDPSGEVVAFDNRSRVHPRLTLDVHPRLAPEDPRVVTQIVGRRVFALIDRPSPTPVRELARLPLGVVAGEDVSRIQPIIHASPGVHLAWVTYRLAYFVEIAKLAQPLGVVYFRWVVDADTGEVIEDAKAPVIPAEAAPP